MELKIIQNHVGCFNMLRPSEKSLTFQMGIFENGKVIQENGIDAKIYYSGEPEEEGDFEGAFENLEWVFEKCYKYADRVISSTDYAAQCILFARLVHENYDVLNEQLVAKEREWVTKKIAELQKRLTVTNIIPQIYETVNTCLYDQIKKYTKWREGSQKELDQIKEGTDKYAELKKRVDGYEAKISLLESQKIVEAEA